MGDLSTFDMFDLIIKHKTYTYFETGTGEGITLGQALAFPFDKYYSVDMDEELLERTRSRLELGDNVTLIHAMSKDALEEYVPQLPADEPILFFLDAHFPGADFAKISYEESLRQYGWDAFPLESEVNVIKKHRDISKDVFLIDDFILYEDGDYDTIREGVTWRYGWLQEELNLNTNADFLYNIFGQTHDMQKSLKHQGYLIITPKESK